MKLLKSINMTASVLLSALLLSLAMFASASAENTEEKVDELKGQVEGMNETMLEMQNTLNSIAKLKFSGYIQSQFRLTETDGAATYSGGNFPVGVHQQFMVRRGRLKATYSGKMTQYVVQLDITQNGVGIKDAYLAMTEPWWKAMTMTAGVFDRPFGFEISYSSSSRESPERSRIFQTLFPGERDLGIKFDIKPQSGMLSMFDAKVGLFNGTGPTANEIDNNKDLIGRVGFQLPFYEANVALDGGVSLYNGKARNNSKFIYEVKNDKWTVDSTSQGAGEYFDRNYFGVDLQSYFSLPLLGGASARFEYVGGQQPSTANSSNIYNVAINGTSTPMYLRDVSGWYFIFVHNLGLNNQWLVKYDVYDPNTAVDGDKIGSAGTNFTAGDIAYNTLGLGFIHHWDSNLKFVFYYEMVENEKVNSNATGSLLPYKEDLKDNVLTIRAQYRF